MATGNELTALRRRRSYCIGHFTRLSKKLDEIEQSGCPRENELIQIKNRLKTYETELRAIQNEIVSIDEEESARGFEIADEYERLELRVITQLSNLRLTTTSQSTNDESAAGRESASLKSPENHFPGHNAKTPSSPLPQGPTDKGSNNDLNKTRNAIQTPPTEKIASTRTPTSPRVTRNSLHNTSSVSPTRDLTTTKFASSLSQQSDTTLPSALNQKTLPIRNSSYHTRNVSPKRGLTTATLASAGTEQSDSTLLITLNLTSFNEPSDPKKERVSPDDKSLPSLISHNLLQNILSDPNDSLLSSQSAVPNESCITGISLESPSAPKIPTYSPTPRQVTVTTSNSHSPPGIITKRMRFERVIGGSPASQSTSNLRTALDESSPSPTDVPFDDTSWAEVFNDTSRSKIHDTSWVVNFTWKSLGIDEEDGDLDYKGDNMPSRQRAFGRIAKFALGTTASSGRLWFTPQGAPWIEVPRSSSYHQAKLIQQNTGHQQSTWSWAAATINSTFTELLIGTLSTGGVCYVA